MRLLKTASKAQVMILDVLILLIICILIINIELEEINIYKNKIKTDKEILNYLEQELILERIISESTFLANHNPQTKMPESNKINIQNINQITSSYSNLCYLKIGDKEVINNKKECKTLITRGVIHNNQFEIIEGGFL